MITTAQPKPNTVELPAVSAAGLQAIMQTMLAQEPAAAKRIRAGLDTLLTCSILDTGEVGVYLLESASHPNTYHKATSFQCGCPDATRRGPGCRHSRALQILHTAQAEATREQWIAAYEQRRASRQDGVA